MLMAYDVVDLDMLQRAIPKTQYEIKIMVYMSNHSYSTEILSSSDIFNLNVSNIYLNAKKNVEIQEFRKIVNDNFDFEVKSVTELKADDKIALIFNTDLPNLSPDEIGKINDEVFELFDKQNYKTIEAVMVL